MEECYLPKAKTKFKGSIFSGGFLSLVFFSLSISVLLLSLCTAGNVTDIDVNGDDTNEYEFCQGDITSDGTLNILDIITSANRILGGI